MLSSVFFFFFKYVEFCTRRILSFSYLISSVHPSQLFEVPETQISVEFRRFFAGKIFFKLCVYGGGGVRLGFPGEIVVVFSFLYISRKSLIIREEPFGANKSILQPSQHAEFNTNKDYRNK